MRAEGRLIIQPGHYPLYRVSPHSAIQTLYSPLGVLVLALALALALLRLLAVDGDVGVVLLLHRHDPLALQLDVIVIPIQKIFSTIKKYFKKGNILVQAKFHGKLCSLL